MKVVKRRWSREGGQETVLSFQTGGCLTALLSVWIFVALLSVFVLLDETHRILQSVAFVLSVSVVLGLGLGFVLFQRIRIDLQTAHLSYAYAAGAHRWQTLDCTTVQKIVPQRATRGTAIRALVLVHDLNPPVFRSGSVEFLDTKLSIDAERWPQPSDQNTVVSPHFKAIIRFVCKVNPAVELSRDIEHYRTS